MSEAIGVPQRPDLLTHPGRHNRSLLVHNVIGRSVQRRAIPKITSASVFSPEPLAMRMQRFQCERRASFQVGHNPLHRNLGLQNGMYVIGPHMNAEQVPATIYARIDDRFQNKRATFRAKNKLGFHHESPSFGLPGRLWRQSRSSPVTLSAGHRSRIGAVKMAAVSSEGEQDTNRFAPGSEPIYLARIGAMSEAIGVLPYFSTHLNLLRSMNQNSQTSAFS